jgi:hypothetical protein
LPIISFAIVEFSPFVCLFPVMLSCPRYSSARTKDTPVICCLAVDRTDPWNSVITTPKFLKHFSSDAKEHGKPHNMNLGWFVRESLG